MSARCKFWLTQLHLFVNFVPSHRCRVPICDADDDLAVNASFVDFALPAREHGAREILKSGSKFDPCRAYSPIDPEGGCVPSNFDVSNASATCEFGHVYDRHPYTETVATQMNLVCDSESQQKILTSITMAGLLIGEVYLLWIFW